MKANPRRGFTPSPEPTSSAEFIAISNNPVALHLRAMKMLYEGLKQNSTIVIVPSSAIESMQLGGLAGLTALTMGLANAKNGASKAAEAIASNGATVGNAVSMSISSTM